MTRELKNALTALEKISNTLSDNFDNLGDKADKIVNDNDAIRALTRIENREIAVKDAIELLKNELMLIAE